MQTCKGEQQAFSSRMPTLHQQEESNLLYGNERYSEETNKIAFSAVQEFIKKTIWF